MNFSFLYQRNALALYYLVIFSALAVAGAITTSLLVWALLIGVIVYGLAWMVTDRKAAKAAAEAAADNSTTK